MKRLGFFLFLSVILSGCGGGGRDDGTVTVTLTGTVFQGIQQGNPGVATDVRVTVVGEGSDDVIITDAGEYSISNVPVGSHTVRAEQPIPQQGITPQITVTCEIVVQDSSTPVNITNDGGGTCTQGTSSVGLLGLNFTLQ